MLTLPMPRRRAIHLRVIVVSLLYLGMPGVRQVPERDGEVGIGIGEIRDVTEGAGIPWTNALSLDPYGVDAAGRLWFGVAFKDGVHSVYQWGDMLETLPEIPAGSTNVQLRDERLYYSARSEGNASRVMTTFYPEPRWLAASARTCPTSMSMRDGCTAPCTRNSWDPLSGR
jgi:hypothetical protein